MVCPRRDRFERIAGAKKVGAIGEGLAEGVDKLRVSVGAASGGGGEIRVEQVVADAEDLPPIVRQ